jgi:hypothetical protein
MKHAIPLNLLLCLVSPLCLAPKTAKQAQVSVFVVEYILRDVCHACAQVGTVKLSFVLDKHGKFGGVESGPTFPRP